jgi:hypothetical protein
VLEELRPADGGQLEHRFQRVRPVGQRHRLIVHRPTREVCLDRQVRYYPGGTVTSLLQAAATAAEQEQHQQHDDDDQEQGTEPHLASLPVERRLPVRGEG